MVIDGMVIDGMVMLVMFIMCIGCIGCIGCIDSWCIDGMFIDSWCIDGMFIDGIMCIDGMVLFQADGKLRIRQSGDSPPKPVVECSKVDGMDGNDDQKAGKFEYIDVEGIMLNSGVWWPKPPNGIMFMFIIDSIV
jgi:hypothetical protein